MNHLQPVHHTGALSPANLLLFSTGGGRMAALPPAILKQRAEVVSKPQIASKDKARVDEKAQSRQRRDEQYISKNLATQYLGVR